MRQSEFQAPSRAAPGGEDLRRAAGALLLGIYRLVRACLLHADATQAVLSLVPATADAIVEVCSLSGTEAVTIAPAGEVVLINGHAVRAPREMPNVARELGALFEACEVREIELDRGVRRADLATFAGLLADAQRDHAAAARVARAALRGIRVRGGEGAEAESAAEAGAGQRSVTARAARSYAVALLVAREIEAGPGAGEAGLHRRALRAAQRIVSAAEEDLGLLVSLAAAKAADPDGAGAAAAAAVLALGMARQLTTDRRALAALVSAGLLCGAGRARLTGGARAADGRGAGGGEGGTARVMAARAAPRALSEADRDRLPASAAIAMTAIGKLHAPAIARAVIAYEALALRAGAWQSAAQGGGRPPALLAQILAVARAFVELRAAPIAGGPASLAPGAPRGARSEAPSGNPGRGEATIDGVVQLLMDRAEGAADRTLVKLLIAALGFFPSGTLVQLSTGELGIVTAVGELPARSARPRVRLLYDARGAQLGAPVDVDLAEPPPDGVPRAVARPIDADAPQARAIRAALAGAFASRPPQKAAPPAPAPSSRRMDGRYPIDPPPTTRRPDRVRTAPAPEPGADSSPGSGAAGASRRSGLTSGVPGRAPHGAPSAPDPAPPISAAWLGRPLSPSGSHAIVPSAPPAPPPPAPPRRPPPVDRAALLEKLRENDMASTQPPPPDVMAPPDVPPPPRLPRSPARLDPRAPHGPHAPPPRTVRSAGLRDLVPGRRIDPRMEPDVEETWTDSMDTIAPPAAHAAHDTGEGWPDLDDLHLHDPPAPPDAHATTPRSPEARGRTTARRHDPRREGGEDDTWDDMATVDPPPPEDSLSERERLLAAYLAERTPLPVNVRELLAKDPRHTEPPSPGQRRATRAPIPREEPEDPPDEPVPSPRR